MIVWDYWELPDAKPNINFFQGNLYYTLATYTMQMPRSYDRRTREFSIPTTKGSLDKAPQGHLGHETINETDKGY